MRRTGGMSRGRLPVAGGEKLVEALDVLHDVFTGSCGRGGAGGARRLRWRLVLRLQIILGVCAPQALNYNYSVFVRRSKSAHRNRPPDTAQPPAQRWPERFVA